MAEDDGDLECRTLTFEIDLAIILENDEQEFDSVLDHIGEQLTAAKHTGHVRLIVKPAADHAKDSGIQEDSYMPIGVAKKSSPKSSYLVLDLSYCAIQTQFQLLLSDGMLLQCFEGRKGSHIASFPETFYRKQVPETDLTDDLFSHLQYFDPREQSIVCFFGDIHVSKYHLVYSKYSYEAMEKPGISLKQFKQECYKGDLRVPFLKCTLMHVACLAGDAESVEYFIHEGTDVDIKDDDGKTSLYYAANEKVMAVLLNHGAEAKTCHLKFHLIRGNNRVKYPNTDIQEHFHKINNNMVDLLLNAGTPVQDYDGYIIYFSLENERNLSLLLATPNIDINDISGKRENPLFYALENNNKKVLLMLIEAGTNLEATYYSRTVIFNALKESTKDCLRVLIEKGANVNAVDSQGKTPLFCSLHSESITQILIEAGAMIDAVDDEGKTPMFYAVTESENITQILIDAGAMIDAFDNEGKTPMFYAVTKSDMNTLQLIVEAGASINHKDQEGNIVLFKWLDDVNVLNYLIIKGANVNASDKHGRTPLFLTTNAETAQILLNKGANKNARDIQGRTALYHAFETNHELFQVLFDAGLRTNLTDKCSLGFIPFAVHKIIELWCLGKDARECKPYEELLFGQENRLSIAPVEMCQILSDVLLVQCLRYFSDDRKDTSHNFFGHGIRKAFYLMSSFLKKTKSTDKKQEIVEQLMNLIKDERPVLIVHVLQICSLFLDFGADPNTPDLTGNTALFYAVNIPFVWELAFNSEIDDLVGVCGLLLSKGSVTWTKNYEGETPLLYFLFQPYIWTDPIWECCHGDRNVKVDICQLLVNAGSSACEVQNTGDCPYHVILVDLFILICQSSGFNILADRLVMIMELLSSQQSGRQLSVNIGDNDLNTPLHIWATLHRNQPKDSKISQDKLDQTVARILELLLQCGAKLNNVNLKNATPLHMCRTWYAARLLLDAGADPNVLDAEGNTFLVAQIKRLTRDGKKDNSRSDNYPQGSRGSLLASFKLYIEREGQERDGNESRSLNYIYPDATNAENNLDIFWAQVLEYKQALWSNKGTGESVLSILIRKESFELAESLLRVVFSTQESLKSSASSSALLDICKDSHNETYWKTNLMDMLLKFGSSVKVTNRNGETPLHLSCRNAINSGNVNNVHCKMVQHLLFYGADCNAQNDDGVTPLQMATEFPEFKEILQRPISIDDVPLLIPWTSKSQRFKPLLAEVARCQKSITVEDIHFHEANVGSGAFGSVHAGINSKDGREVAIKRIVMGHMIRPEDLREIKSLIKLEECEQVLGYLDYLKSQNFVYIVLELMDGNLEEYLDTKPDPINLVKLCKDIVLGVEFLHGRRIVHRDLKPENILYRESPLSLKIADFGLSNKLDILSSATVWHTNAGTRCWMAPELMKEKLAGQTMYTEHSDVFACGLLMHYILSRKRHPFAPSDCMDKSMMEVQNETERNILNFNPSFCTSISPEACHLITGMIAKDKHQRITATDALAQPFFWTKSKKRKFLEAVGNQPEIETPRTKRTCPSTVELDLDKSFTANSSSRPWMLAIPHIYNEMTSISPRRKHPRMYDTNSGVELVRFIRNAYAHVSEASRPTGFQIMLLEDYVFFDHFPWLLIEVYKAVTNAGWDKSRKEVDAALEH